MAIIKNEVLQRIEQALQKDPKQKEELSAVTARLVRSDNLTQEEAYVKAVKTVLGIDITLSDLEKINAEYAELDREELDAVTGGDDLELCLAAWACFTLFLHHFEQNKNEACLADYQCVGVFHTDMWDCKSADTF